MGKKYFVFILVLIFLSCRKENINLTKVENNNIQNEYLQKESDVDINKITKEESDIEDGIAIVDIFTLNIFENIYDNIDYYRNKDDFTIIDNTISESYRERGDPNNEMIASNDEIIIYFKKYSETIYREIEILKSTDKYVLGKYIGLSKYQIIGIFGEENTPWPNNLGHLQYVNRKFSFDLYINFCFSKDDENKIINKIEFGDFI